MLKDVREMSKEKDRFVIHFEIFEKYILAAGIVAAISILMYWIGRNVLGEGVIALLYLAPISWVAARWGQGPGILAAVSSALAFDFLFVPPFYTFTVANLEGWLLLGIFLTVAIVIIGRVQVGLVQAQKREREAVMMYELSSILAGARTRDAVARALAGKIQEVYQAELIQVSIDDNGQPIVISQPSQAPSKTMPDLIIPILVGRNLAGEVRMWRGEFFLPSTDDRVLQNFVNQSALAIERARLEKQLVPLEK